MGCACCFALAAPRAFADAMTPEVERHLAVAKQAAGTDLEALLVLGRSADPTFKAPTPDLEKLMALPAPPPGKAFDNLFFVGGKWVSAWALTTSDGIILFDAMNNEDDAEHTIERGLTTVGLDPSKVKTIIVTHGHGDHYPCLRTGSASRAAVRAATRIIAARAARRSTGSSVATAALTFTATVRHTARSRSLRPARSTTQAGSRPTCISGAPKNCPGSIFPRASPRHPRTRAEKDSNSLASSQRNPLTRFIAVLDARANTLATQYTASEKASDSPVMGPF